ncbi:R3H-associated N-terminal domain [Trinorchestia longiramus]|nr:R3H-associated N-terminal domain [Trinorchestia longiramus]
MVAITDNIFTRKPHGDGRTINNTVGAVPVTPTASDCLSLSGDSTCDSVASVPACPVRRDPALLLERLENCAARRKMGRRKRRRATNEAALAVLVEGYEEDSHLFVRPYRSAFTQLFESQDKMTLWTHFMNMSEEHQELYLAGAEQRAKLLNRSLPCSSTSPSAPTSSLAAGARDAGGALTDTRSIHPAALPHDVPQLVRVGEPSPDSGLVSDPVLGPSLFNDHFAPPPRPNHLPFAVANPPTSLPPGDQLLDHGSLTSDLDEYFSHSYNPVSAGFSHSTPKKDSESRIESGSLTESSEALEGWASRKESNALVNSIGDALCEEAEDTETSPSSSFEIIDPEDDFEL